MENTTKKTNENYKPKDYQTTDCKTKDYKRLQNREPIKSPKTKGQNK